MYFSMVFIQDFKAVAYPSAGRAFHRFWRGETLGKLPGGFMGCWLGSAWLFWGFPLAAGCQGRQEEEGG